jgi:hypothetical protein
MKWVWLMAVESASSAKNEDDPFVFATHVCILQYIKFRHSRRVRSAPARGHRVERLGSTATGGPTTWSPSMIISRMQPFVLERTIHHESCDPDGFAIRGERIRSYRFYPGALQFADDSLANAIAVAQRRSS